MKKNKIDNEIFVIALIVIAASAIMEIIKKCNKK